MVFIDIFSCHKERRKNMTRVELIKVVSEKTGTPKITVNKIIDQFLDEIIYTIYDGDDVQLQGFGAFVPSTRKEQMNVDLNTGKRVLQPATNTVRFKPSKALKNFLNDR